MFNVLLVLQKEVYKTPVARKPFLCINSHFKSEHLKW